LAQSGQYVVSTSYKTNDGLTAPGPFLLPPGFVAPTNNVYPQLVVAIPYVAGTDTGIMPPRCNLTGNADFTLQWDARRPAALNAIVNVAPANVFSTKNRPALLASFRAFAQALEALEHNGTNNCLVPGGAALITARLAAALPLQYDELLAFNHSFSPANRCVDLAPGMDLVIEVSNYQYLAPPTLPGGARNAYGGGTASRHTVRRRLDGTLGFNAFLDAVAGFQIETLNPPQIAGLLDLAAVGRNRAHYRVIYPPQLDSAVAINLAPSPARNVTLLAADTLADLESATQHYLQDGTTGGVGAASFFTGRASVVPHVPVRINGLATTVPLGTTLRDLLAAQCVATPYEIAQLGVQLTRWTHSSLTALDPTKSILGPAPVRFEDHTAISASTRLTQWDLPLAIGDIVSWAAANG
jgi:hypothetical protein